jgi:4-carboxymuconolactone decarboxylase
MNNVLSKMRYEPKQISNLNEECVKILAQIPGDGLKGKYAPVNVLGMLMHGEKIMERFLDYWVTSKNKMCLNIREQELVILRMGFLYNCNYVWKHHVPVGEEFGITKNEFFCLKKEHIDPKDFLIREEALLIFTDEFIKKRTICNEIWDKYTGVLSKNDVIDLIHLVSQYVLFSLTNNVLNVEIEEPLTDILSL